MFRSERVALGGESTTNKLLSLNDDLRERLDKEGQINKYIEDLNGALRNKLDADLDFEGKKFESELAQAELKEKNEELKIIQENLASAQVRLDELNTSLEALQERQKTIDAGDEGAEKELQLRLIQEQKAAIEAEICS